MWCWRRIEMYNENTHYTLQKKRRPHTVYTILNKKCPPRSRRCEYGHARTWGHWSGRLCGCCPGIQCKRRVRILVRRCHRSWVRSVRQQKQALTLWPTDTVWPDIHIQSNTTCFETGHGGLSWNYSESCQRRRVGVLRYSARAEELFEILAATITPSIVTGYHALLCQLVLDTVKLLRSEDVDTTTFPASFLVQSYI